MPGLLIIAHAPLASALRAVGAHVFPDVLDKVSAIDVQPEWTMDVLEHAVRQALAVVADPQALVLIDVFGATPCNVATRIAEAPDVRIVSGVNVPMLWRALGHLSEPLDTLAARALAGGAQGMMSVGSSRPQNQSHPGRLHDQSVSHHQQ